MIAKHHWPYWLLLAETLILATLIQLTLFVASDVEYLSHIAEMMLSGKQYGIDFYETNPPMILYLYLPPLWLHHVSALNYDACLRLYVLILASISISASFYYLKKIVRDDFILDVSFALLLFSALLLPSNQFGQREHLFFLLFAPYVFASACALRHIAVNKIMAVLTGVAAAIGCCMKPYFLAPLILIELYFIYHKRQCFGWIRIETITILLVLISYLASTYYFFPTYFSVILPLVNQFYFIGIAQPWSLILYAPQVVFCIAVSCISFMAVRSSRYPELTMVLVLASIGTTLAFLVTRTMWFYHTLPALAFASMTISFIIAECCSPLTLRSSLLFLTASFLALYIPIIMFHEYTFGADFLYEKQCKEDLINTLAAQPGKHSVICFSGNTMTDCYPLIHAINSQHQSRYPFFWWLRGAMQQASLQQGEKQIERFMNQTAEDLEINQTRWIVINSTTTKLLLGDDFNYFAYFSTNAKMRRALATYHYWKTVDQYDIYQRTPS